MWSVQACVQICLHVVTYSQQDIYFDLGIVRPSALLLLIAARVAVRQRGSNPLLDLQLLCVMCDGERTWRGLYGRRCKRRWPRLSAICSEWMLRCKRIRVSWVWCSHQVRIKFAAQMTFPLLVRAMNTAPKRQHTASTTEQQGAGNIRKSLYRRRKADLWSPQLQTNCVTVVIGERLTTVKTAALLIGESMYISRLSDYTGQQNLTFFLAHEEKYLILIELLRLNSNV